MIHKCFFGYCLDHKRFKTIKENVANGNQDKSNDENETTDADEKDITKTDEKKNVVTTEFEKKFLERFGS